MFVSVGNIVDEYVDECVGQKERKREDGERERIIFHKYCYDITKKFSHQKNIINWANKN